ncbi:hypothetical protein D9758_005524 [Tetrapyrgos nigripes]|uniref:D-xylose 1-dehydrogenase (NADP(+), D-xylono-1,5-lactone-forming) n=1 Tax=Tetrapyrgos nigripes TaxID=182062 RepID=A0A8H5GGV0_9AGAR|nr:hypothetical protein D9758_005524 [Tetrapyrgos nigripes]
MVFSTIKRIYNAFSPSEVPTTQDNKPLKFGILGAANIAPNALIIPAKTHPEVLVYAVAARDIKRADAFAKKHGVQKVYGGTNGYQELLDDPDIDVIYNPLPNGLHYEWTMKALAAGKHVLLEKPAANTAEETRQMFDLAEKKNLVLMEAFHYRFHPAVQRVKAILDSGELGKIKSITHQFTFPAGVMGLKKDDIRFNWSLGGGSFMDMGTYNLNCLRYLGGNPTQILSANAVPSHDPKVDRGMTVTLALPNDIIGTMTCDFGIPWKWNLIPSMPVLNATVECEGGSVKLSNFVMPTLYHSITVNKKKATGTDTVTRTEAVYKFSDAKMEGKGEEWWMTYRYMLDAFVDRLKGREPQTWITKEDSIVNAEWIDKVYEKYHGPQHNQASLQCDSKPLKFGILGAAAIAPAALIIPAKTHPEVVVYAVAARDIKRAEAFAKKHGVPKFYGGSNGYQELLDDSEIDVVYNPLPVGLHYEWTMKALAAGKHVLLEKPATITSEEMRQMFELAEKKNLVLMEAFHSRFHPAIQRVKAILDSGELGKIKSICNTLTVPAGSFKKDDIRFDWSLGGGSFLDMGCYTLSCLRYLGAGNPTQVLSATAIPSYDPQVDRGMTATLALPNDIIGTITSDMGTPWNWNIIPSSPQVLSTVECEGGSVSLLNYVSPTLYHTITVSKKNGTGTVTRAEKVYTFSDGKMEGKGEEWWLTYRYMLEAFVDGLKGRTPQTWVTKEDSIANMEWIEKVYEKSSDKKKLRSVVDQLGDGSKVVDLIWDNLFKPVHGLTTSALGGYKLGSMKGDDNMYRVGIFVSNKKTLKPPPIVVAEWNAEPTGAQVVAGLNQAIDAA